MAVSYEIKYTLSHDLAIKPLYIYPKEFKVKVKKRFVYECLFIIAPNWKQPKRSIKRRTDKQMMIYSYNEYFSTIKKKAINIPNNIDECQNCHNRKKPDTKEEILFD